MTACFLVHRWASSGALTQQRAKGVHRGLVFRATYSWPDQPHLWTPSHCRFGFNIWIWGWAQTFSLQHHLSRIHYFVVVCSLTLIISENFLKKYPFTVILGYYKRDQNKWIFLIAIFGVNIFTWFKLQRERVYNEVSLTAILKHQPPKNPPSEEETSATDSWRPSRLPSSFQFLLYTVSLSARFVTRLYYYSTCHTAVRKEM